VTAPEPDDDAWADPTAAYDAVAPEYADRFDAELATKPFDRALLERFGADLDPATVLVDLGCGPGHIGASLQSRVGRVVGVDLSVAMLDQARLRHPAVRGVRGDLRALPLAPGAADAVVCFYSLIHLRHAEVPGALAEIRRILRRGAPALLAVQGGHGVIHTDHWFDRPVRVDATLFEASELSALVERAGLKVRERTRRDPYEAEAQTERLYIWATRP
jgi:SAM-dependent methyltransferase